MSSSTSSEATLPHPQNDSGREHGSKSESDRDASKTEIQKKIVKRGTRSDVSPSVKFNRYGFGNINDDINTPGDLFDILNRRFAFTFDPFPCRANRPADFDGFVAEWKSPAFCNPPYSCIENAIEKALAEMTSERRVLSVFLIPMRGNNKYWTRLVWPRACAIWFFEGRMRFEGYTNASPMPMSLVVFDPSKCATTADGVTLRNTFVKSGIYAWHELSVV